MAFKAKSKNRNPINTKQTLDATHQSILDDFEKRRLNIDNVKQQIILLEEEISKDNQRILESNDPIEKMKIRQNIWDMDDELQRLKEEVDNTENNIDERQYLLKTGNLLSAYYNTEEDEQDGNSFENFNKSFKNKKDGKKSVLDWISYDKKTKTNYSLKEGKPIIELTSNKKKSDKDDNSNETNKSNDSKNDSKNNKNNNSGIRKSPKMSKKMLYQKYMSLIDEDFVNEESDGEFQDMDMCDSCNTEMLLEQNTGTLLCVNCGIQEQLLIDSDKPSYKDPPKEMTSFCYKRINHLNEFLAQFQAKETTEIPEEIYNEILVEIKKERIENMADITQDKLRTILRKIKRNDYYEHRAYIINQLNGLPPPVISPEVEEIIRSMFKEIQIPFQKYCPKKRKNFLSYNYVMYKFFELLELDEYLKCFQLLKSRNKLHQQDVIWKKICADVKWQYIPSL
jgi:hypothetical protein